jgi:hypothetical protein
MQRREQCICLYHVRWHSELFTFPHAVYFFLICIVGGGIKVHSTLRPLNGLLCQPRVIMIEEKSVEWLAGETEVLGENLPQCRFVHHKPHMLPVREPGPPRWEAELRHGPPCTYLLYKVLRTNCDNFAKHIMWSVFVEGTLCVLCAP